MEKPWAIHQVETTVDFAKRSWVATWLLGLMLAAIGGLWSDHWLMAKIALVVGMTLFQAWLVARARPDVGRCRVVWAPPYDGRRRSEHSGPHGRLPGARRRSSSGRP